MNIKLTKNGRIVLFVILGILVLGSGGYLLWRVLQPETVAPEDSEAGTAIVGPCNNYDYCTDDKIGVPGSCDSGAGMCARCQCQDGVWIRVCLKSGQNCSAACNECGHSSQPPPTGCTSGSQCKNKCYWPNVAYCDSSGQCVCKRYDSFSNPACGTNTPCSPTCPTGYGKTCPSGATCTTTTEVECNSKCPECNNLYYNKITCYKPDEIGVCEGSSWLEQPSGTYTSCSGIVAKVEATDPDGIGTNISVKVNGQSKTGYTTASTTSGTSITYEFSESDCTEPGEYSISFTWNDSKGNSGDDCTLNTSFTIAQEDEPYCGDGIKQSNEICDPNAQGSDSQCTNNIGETVDCTNDCTCPTVSTCGDGVLVDTEQCELGNPTGYTCTWDSCNQETCLCEEQQNPDWTISKTGAQQCIEEGEETYSKAIYSITITNVGEGEGSIDKIVDELDDKVLETYVNDISDNGIYNAGLITWDLEGDNEIFSPEESLTLSYYIKVPATSFGIYQNTVTAYPTEGDEFSDDESVNLTCEIPQTGIFDSIILKISLGIILILLGANWSKINYSVNETVSDTRIKRFERKIKK